MTARMRPNSRATERRSATEAIKCTVSVGQVFRSLGGRIRGGKRADCLLCTGSAKGTVAYKERVWRCHRCLAGGDIFSLVQAVHGCDFPTAQKWLAEMTRISLPTAITPDERRRFARERAQYERISSAAQKLEMAERHLRIFYRNRIHACEHKQGEISRRLETLGKGAHGEADGCWRLLAAFSTLLQADLAAYTILSFGTELDRANFVLKPELRQEMIAAVQWKGGFVDDDQCWIEVLR